MIDKDRPEPIHIVMCPLCKKQQKLDDCFQTVYDNHIYVTCKYCSNVFMFPQGAGTKHIIDQIRAEEDFKDTVRQRNNPKPEIAWYPSGVNEYRDPDLIPVENINIGDLEIWCANCDSVIDLEEVIVIVDTSIENIVKIICPECHIQLAKIPFQYATSGGRK